MWVVASWIRLFNRRYAVTQSPTIGRSDCERVCFRAAGVGANPTRLPFIDKLVMASESKAEHDPTRGCSACGNYKPREAFGKKQWSARAVRRCRECVDSGRTVTLCEHGRGRDCTICDDAAAAAAASAAMAAAARIDALATRVAETRVTRAAPPEMTRRQRRILRRVCQVCVRRAPLSEERFPVCGGCMRRRYCSESCQVRDWGGRHSEMCALMAEKRCETPACPGNILKRCDDCASVFCIVCEDGDHLNPCSMCDKASCENCWGVRYCSSCYNPYCEDCRFVMHCGECFKGYCESCKMSGFCSLCKTPYCEDCRPTWFCSLCNEQFCDECRFTSFCEDCGEPFCEECRPVRFCDDCGCPFCEECRDVYYCEECSLPFCEDCRESRYCERCDVAYCPECTHTCPK